MESNKSSKICEAQGIACKKEVRALCYHCSKNLCRVHLIQHAQLIEDATRTKLHSLADTFNELLSRFDNISISDNILKNPFVQLEKWRVEAHEKINQIVENKRQELNDEIDKYRKEFLTKNAEQLVKMNNSKRMIAELIEESDASANQIVDLQTSIDEAEKYLSSFITHEINVTATTPIWYVDIDTHFFGSQFKLNHELQEFKITYVRLNGVIRNYYVKTKKNGKISDLKTSFIRQYFLSEELGQSSYTSVATNHRPKYDFIVPTKVYKHQIPLIFEDNKLLDGILDDDFIVFYEIPFSLNEKDPTNILMPCHFRRQPNKSLFALPIYLNVPRRECRGQHILDSLRDSIGKYFPLNPTSDQTLYDSYLDITVNDSLERSKLNDVLKDDISFDGRKVILNVNINSQIADKYERNILEQLIF